MFHKLIVCQNINEDCTVNVNYVQREGIRWSYETHIDKKSSDTAMFPITFDRLEEVTNERKGNETTCRRIDNSNISFNDDYGVPGGAIVCITGPNNYVPTIVKLKSKPTFNHDGYSHNIPTHIEMKSNITSRISSVVMYVLENTIYSVSIEFTKVDESYIFTTSKSINDTFDFTLNAVKKKLVLVDEHEIERLHPELGSETLKELITILRDIVSADCQEVNESVKHRFTKLLPSLLGTGSSLVTLIDSYNNSGIVGQVMSILIKAVT